MVDIILKVSNTEVDVLGANTIHNSVLFRAYAPATATLTFKTAANTTYGTVTMPINAIEIFVKAPTDTVSASATIKCTPVAYR